MKINSISINPNFQGRVYNKSTKKNQRELNKLYDTNAEGIAPHFISEFNRCRQKIEAMTPDDFSCVFDIKLHKPIGFASNPAYYYKIQYKVDRHWPGAPRLMKSEEYVTKVGVPYHSYEGVSTQEAVTKTIENFAQDVIMIGNSGESSYEAIERYGNKADSRNLAQIIYENLDSQPPNGKVKYVSLADVAKFIEYNSKQEYFSPEKTNTFVEAFNTLKSRIEKETPDSFDCLLVPDNKSLTVICHDSKHQDQCEFEQKISLDKDEYMSYFGFGYSLGTFYDYVRSSMNDLANRIVSYANSCDNREDMSKLQNATNYKKLL